MARTPNYKFDRMEREKAKAAKKAARAAAKAEKAEAKNQAPGSSPEGDSAPVSPAALDPGTREG